MPEHTAPVARRRLALLLWMLSLLFGARVLGQALVEFAGVTWLPAMEAWYSGLVPYGVLLPAQMLISWSRRGSTSTRVARAESSRSRGPPWLDYCAGRATPTRSR